MARFGIATTWNGTNYRSRTEATFAAFFAELKIAATYEPCDLNNYIPDFDLLFKKRPILCEVKGSEEDIEVAKLKIAASGWEGDAAIVLSGARNVIGVMYEAGIGWDEAILTFCLACKAATICTESGHRRCRNCLADSRNLWWAFNPQPAWAAAQNATQWRAA